MDSLLDAQITRIPFDAFAPPPDRTDAAFAPPAQALPDFFLAPEDRLLEVAVAELVQPRGEAQRRQYNPLVLCGPSGTGKTHVALGLVNVLRVQRPGSRQAGLVTTGADWSRDVAQAIETQSLAAWRDRCRQARFLVLDDILPLHRKLTAQRELLSLIDDFFALDLPCIVTSRLNPLAVHELIPELAGRLTAGLTVPLHPPDARTRRAFLEELVAEQGLDITAEGLDLLSDSCGGTVPEIRSFVCEIAHQLPLDRCLGAIELRRKLRKHPQDDPHLSLGTIASVVARYFRLSRSKITSASRRHGVAHARCVAIFLSRQLTKSTLKRIGEYFGGRDHTTVLHAYRKIQELVDSDPETRIAIEQLTEQLTKGRD